MRPVTCSYWAELEVVAGVVAMGIPMAGGSYGHANIVGKYVGLTSSRGRVPSRGKFIAYE